MCHRFNVVFSETGSSNHRLGWTGGCFVVTRALSEAFDFDLFDLRHFWYWRAPNHDVTLFRDFKPMRETFDIRACLPSQSCPSGA
ncbi:hypothetical protein TTRE_0000087101 [Trichuris trichiura]|uniref:Uncharacterized protein n=1 Tax=Trichuris trichiura TaxID=36087 RepID=A0A077YXX4_TRITR|nr:hypothetical protein TTRE_0000087101 [Trichuris trichiura]